MFVLFFLLILCNSSYSVCYAEKTQYVLHEGSTSNKVTVEELLVKYQLYSRKIALIDTSYDLKQTEIKIAAENRSTISETLVQTQISMNDYLCLKKQIEEQLNKMNAEYEQYLKDDNIEADRIESYENQINDLVDQLETVDKMILSLNTSYGTATTNYDSACLQADLKQFISSNEIVLKREEKEKLLYDFYSKVLSVMSFQYKEKYYNLFTEYLNTQLKVENIKKKHGLGNTLNVLDLNNQIAKNVVASKIIDDSITEILKNVKAETKVDDSTITLEYDLNKNFSENDIEKLTTKYMANNSSYLQAKYYVRAYKDYLSNSSGLSSLEKKQISETIEYYNIEESIMKQTIEEYVSSMISVYEQTILNLKASEQEVAYAEQQYRKANKLYEYGKTSLLEVQKHHLNMLEKENSYVDLLVRKVKLDYILQHNIYGAEV